MNDEYSMQGFIQQVCEEIGPRISTSEPCLKAGEYIQAQLKPVTDENHLEQFECHPTAFLAFPKVMFILQAIAVVLVTWYPFVSGILGALAVAIAVFEDMLLKEVIDPFFPSQTDHNVVATLKPTEEAKKLIILSGHHDSAYEFPLFEKFRAKVGLLAYLMVGLMLLSAVLSFVQFGLEVAGILSWPLRVVFAVVYATTLLVVWYLAFNLYTSKTILGANDNLSGVAVVIALAHYFHAHKPQNLELRFISFSCEEVARGSKRYVATHREELHQKDVEVINFDMVGCGKLAIITAETAYMIKHARGLAERLKNTSEEVGANFQLQDLTFGFTDAGFFSKEAIPAVTILGFNADGYPDTWHTLEDTPGTIIDQNLQAAYKTARRYITTLDTQV